MPHQATVGVTLLPYRSKLIESHWWNQWLTPKIQLDQGPTGKHYWAAIAIDDADLKIPYPQTEAPDLELLKEKIKPVLDGLTEADWNNLSLLTLLLEKYGSFISLDGSNVAFFDLVRATSAIAAALTDAPEATHLSLVAGDLSSIQNFIYTISSDGALKSLRARSFYLELVTEEVVQQLLETLKLPRSSVIYAGGGNLYLLAPVGQTVELVQCIQQRFNQWLLKEFQGKVFQSVLLASAWLGKWHDRNHDGINVFGRVTARASFCSVPAQCCSWI